MRSYIPSHAYSHPSGGPCAFNRTSADIPANSLILMTPSQLLRLTPNFLVALHLLTAILPVTPHCPTTSCTLGFTSGIRWPMILGTDAINQCTSEWNSTADRLISGGVEYEDWDARVSQNIKVNNLALGMVDKLNCYEELKPGPPGCLDVYSTATSQFVSAIRVGWCRVCRGFIPKMQAHRDSVDGKTKPIPKADELCQPKLAPEVLGLLTNCSDIDLTLPSTTPSQTGPNTSSNSAPKPDDAAKQTPMPSPATARTPLSSPDTATQSNGSAPSFTTSSTVTNGASSPGFQGQNTPLTSPPPPLQSQQVPSLSSNTDVGRKQQLSGMKTAKLKRLKTTIRRRLRAIRRSVTRLEKGAKGKKTQNVDTIAKAEKLKTELEEAKKNLRLVNEVLKSKKKQRKADKGRRQ